MLSYGKYQTGTGVLRQIGTGPGGDEFDIDTFACRVDPVFGFKTAFTQNNEQITGKTTILDGLPEIDLSHRRWKLDYNGNSYVVADLVPFPLPGTNVPSHYEVMLQ